MGHNSTTYQLEKVQDVNDLMCDAWAGVEQNVIGDATDQLRRRLSPCLHSTNRRTILFEYPLRQVLVKHF